METLGSLYQASIILRRDGKIKKEKHIIIITTKRIEKGEKLFYDYNAGRKMLDTGNHSIKQVSLLINRV
jgi:hypothetical protein